MARILKALRGVPVMAVAVAALLLAVAGVVMATNSSSPPLKVCVPAKESKPLVTPRPGNPISCKTGYAIEELGREGPEGKPGTEGRQGPEGKPGAEGKQGPEGKPAPSILASGASESGVFAMHGGGSSIVLTEGITFRIPLAAALPASQVIFTQLGRPVTNCPGPGLAGKGYLCIYYAVRTLVGNERTLNVEGIPPTEGAGKLGFTLEVSCAAEPSAYEGTYTVTGA